MHEKFINVVMVNKTMKRLLHSQLTTNRGPYNDKINFGTSRMKRVKCLNKFTK